MIDKAGFTKIKKDMDVYDSQRELLIRKSRDIVKLSKQLIYSVHREDIDSAKKFEKEITKALAELRSLLKTPKLSREGSVKVAVMEYVEAVAYLGYVTNKKILAYSADLIDPDYYLMGLCDLTGELTRRAVNEAINENFSKVDDIRKLVDEIYGMFCQLDIRENELRRKFDSIKYDLKKLEDLVCDLKLQGKL